MPACCSTTASARSRACQSFLSGSERLDFPDVIRLVGLSAQEVLDSRGNPTVSVTGTTENGSATALDPAGDSAGPPGGLPRGSGEAGAVGKTEARASVTTV